MDASLGGSLERETLRKVYLRVVPCCFVLFIVCYIDRINVSIAALTMNRDLGLSAHVYGLAAGAFFWSYCLLAVPSNLILHKVGAGRWLGSIMIAWGLVGAATALAVGPVSFFILRVLLGAAESGLFPGLMVYIYRWFPQNHRSKAVGWFMISMTLASVVGSPMSTGFLHFDGIAGLRGWQWVFVGEGIPTALLGVVALFVLTERPSEARWLKPEGRSWLEAELAKETHEIERGHHSSGLAAMGNPRVLVLSLLWAGIVWADVGLVFFIPQFLRGAGASVTQAGLFSALPYVFGTLAMIAFGYISDHPIRGVDLTKYRFGVLVVVSGLATIGLVLAAALHTSLFWVLVGFSLANIGIFGFRPPFLPLPSVFLTGSAVAAGIALINALGNFAGYVGAIAVGYARDITGNFEAAIYVLAAGSLVAGLAALGCCLWWVPRTAGQATLRSAEH